MYISDVQGETDWNSLLREGEKVKIIKNICLLASYRSIGLAWFTPFRLTWRINCILFFFVREYHWLIHKKVTHGMGGC